MKWFFKRSAGENHVRNGGAEPRNVRLRRFGLKQIVLPRPRVASERGRSLGWLRLPAE